MFWTLVLVLCGLSAISWFLGSQKSIRLVSGRVAQLHSKPVYHGALAALYAFGPALFVLIVGSILSTIVVDRLIISDYATHISNLSGPQFVGFMQDVRSLASGRIASFPDEIKIAAAEVYRNYFDFYVLILGLFVIAIALICIFRAQKRIHRDLRARNAVERVIMWIMIASSTIAILTTIGIVFSLISETLTFFSKVSFFDFLFGIHWSPQSAFEGAGADSQVENARVFGAIPLFAGTLLITFIAISVAAPIGLFTAIYLTEYASPRLRSAAKPVLEILAGIPTVVYGFFAVLTIAPFFRGAGESIGLSVSSESALAAGVVMGIMIIPFVSSLSDDVINAVPQSLRDGSAGLGATRSETVRKVVLPAALPGIVSALILAVSRAIGETMIVVMAAGLSANLTINPLQAVTTVTVQIVTLLVGDQEFDSAKTLAAFALGLTLFVITLILNYGALAIVRRYREQYD